jgi:hypothetical protein
LVVTVFENGEPVIVVKVFAVGSNQRAVTGPAKFVMATVSVCGTGAYATPNVPFAVKAAVT